jgi:hypothetical protein
MPTLDYAPDAILCTSVIGLSYLILGDREHARPFYDRWAASVGAGTDRQVADLFDALEGRADREAFARRLLALPRRSARDPTSGNLFGDLDIPVLLMLLDGPGLALDYLERESQSPKEVIDLSWAMLMPGFDPIRCDPRFVAAVERVQVVDRRAAKLCAGKG